jgi:NADH-quinone oxidoreductase subunit M
MIYDRRHTRMMADYGGLARVMPLFAAFLMTATLSSIAVPGTFGFVGEFLVLLGSFERYPMLTVAATIGVVLSACYMLWAIQRIIFNPLAKDENRHLPDLNWREAGMLLPLCALIVWMGVYPAPFLKRMEPSITRLVQQVESGAARQAAYEAATAAPASLAAEER